jgi:hypothetical protein
MQCSLRLTSVLLLLSPRLAVLIYPDYPQSQGCIVTAHLICRLIMQGHLRTPDNQESVARCEWAFGPVVLPDHARGAGKNNRPVAGNQKLLLLSICGVHQGPFASMATSAVLQPYLVSRGLQTGAETWLTLCLFNLSIGLRVRRQSEW